MNTIAYFEIQSSEPAREIKFYETVFGWAFNRDSFISIEYYRIETAGMQGGLLKRPAETPSLKMGSNAFTCSVEVENFDATAELIIEIGGQITMPKFAIPGKCWQGYFTDADNNGFGIFQADENAQ